MSAETIDAGAPRRTSFEGGFSARYADPAFKWALTALAALVLALIAFFFVFLISKAHVALAHQGLLSFAFSDDWNPPKEAFGAFSLLFGTVVTAIIALVIALPVAVSSAIFINEFATARLKGPLTLLVDLLASVPSVVYAIWGFLVLQPFLKPVQQWLADTLGFLPWVGGEVPGPGYFLSGLVLAIMITPIISAISREVIATVPVEHKEAAKALGATKWEVLRLAVLPYSRAGITGAALLGLGRALGETIAVAYLLGGYHGIGDQIFGLGDSLAGAIANEFGEAASDPIYSGALIGCGLLLFVVTLIVNALARGLVARAESKQFRAAAQSHAAPAMADAVEDAVVA
ncbi:MAG TPA: phosphate ABC transporter permease subunit PstC [Solirubrobacteraceae bacterium]|jgi:phosphate ABC transporter permease protein PstC|nr:phosphate ABC transporter permease subunit PstC [Solirubrobacteraceae bacterium]